MSKKDRNQTSLVVSVWKTAILFFVLGVFGLHAGAQNNKRVEKLFADAQELYSGNGYDGAIEACKKVLSIDPAFVNAHLLLADIYHDIDSTRLELHHLSEAGKLTDHPLVDFRLGEAFYKMGRYSEALHFYEKYKDYEYIPEKRQFLLACKMASCKFAIQSIKNPVEFDPVNLGDEINSPNDEYWPTPSLDGKRLVFTRLMKDPGSRPQEDFFMAELDSLNWEKAAPLTDVNTPENEGAQTLSADSKILFFTACNRDDGYGSCDIYFSRFVNGKWTEPRNAGEPLNSGAWEAQPSFSSDNRFLYFSSNRPGGKGKKDIWRIEFLGFSDSGNPRWKAPENLSEINTVGDEISPFIHANNHNFYFASDTHVGMGGLDLFTATLDESGELRDLKNLGYPINTHEDDMGLTISSIGNVAYFSSARNNGAGLDIFSFNLDRGLSVSPVTYVQAKITDKKTGQPVSAEIELVNLNARINNNRIENADENGEIMLCLPLRRNYAFSVSEKGYLFYSKSIMLADENTLTDPYVLDIELEPIEVGAEMDLYNIYYETDSYAILPQSEPELQKLVKFLKNNADLKVEIQGHTDSTGNPEDNLVLSENRARSVVDYLVNNNIGLSRLEYRGYGDTVPVATNETAEGRSMNRRTTIKIIEK